MLIKRNDNGNKVDVLYESSNILASSWDKNTNDLIITFKRGEQYVFHNVKPTDYARFELAESQGQEFNKRIKNVYKFEKLRLIDIADLLKEINEFRTKEILIAEKNLITAMTVLINSYGKKNSIDIKELENIELFINKLKEIKEKTNNE